jgi:hypothetical protein
VQPWGHNSDRRKAVIYFQTAIPVEGMVFEFAWGHDSLGKHFPSKRPGHDLVFLLSEFVFFRLTEEYSAC